MFSTSLKSFLGGVALLAAPQALADSTTTIPAFNAAIATARTSNSPGGTTVRRAEMKNAVNLFLYDDGRVDAAERTFLGARINDLVFNIGVTATAKKYMIDVHELNDGATTYAPLWLDDMAQTPEQLFGATGPLTTSSSIKEGYIPNGQGVANQETLSYKAAAAFGLRGVGAFTPITVQELLAKLSAQVISGTPNSDEVDGALALITQISRNSNRLYTTGWSCQTYCGGGGPGDMGGYFIAAVSTDRQFVRMVRVTTWSD
ncbi:hypothetical protein HUA78_16955 [Myxococcus sp. CA033]|uniref:hypothetical protein n=1 Tax=Myxococcus sp. CA033 TaxID=2741516 RepID=UPI00157B6F3B|nr:hypothetical protein [Myxococcus sp. CA033]NTX36138.1 hypothetical protein [Myxococcus sp. CA033]